VIGSGTPLRPFYQQRGFRVRRRLRNLARRVPGGPSIVCGTAILAMTFAAPLVKVFYGGNSSMLLSFFAYNARIGSGVYVAAAAASGKHR